MLVRQEEEKETKTNKEKKKRQCLARRRQLDVSHFSVKTLACYPALSLESFPELAVNSQCNCPRATKSDVPLFLVRAISNSICR